MRLDEYIMRTFGFENITLPSILIREGQVTVNGKVVLQIDFPVSSQDSVVLIDPVLAKKTIHYWNLKKYYDHGKMSFAEDILAFGLDNDEVDFFIQKKHSLTVVCLPQEKDLYTGIETLVANPLFDELSKKTRRKYNIFAFGPRFDAFRIGKILDVNKSMLIYGSNILIKLSGGDQEIQGQRTAILSFVKNLDMEEVLFEKSPYGRQFAWMMVKKQ